MADALLTDFAWRGDTLIVSNDDHNRRIRRKHLSATVMQGVLQCPAKVAGTTLLPRIHDPFGTAELGVSAHDVLEKLYDEPPQNRTLAKADSLIAALGAEEWSVAKLERQSKEMLALNEQNRQRWTETVTAMVRGDFALEDPTTRNVYKTEWDIRGIFIAGNVPFLAKIDRTDVVETPEGEPDGFEIIDYKSGKAPKRLRNGQVDTKFGDDKGDQMRVYAASIHAETGIMPVRATLRFIAHGEDYVADLSEPKMMQTLGGARTAWSILQSAADKGEYATRPSALCGWCELANACPVAKITTDKAKDAAAKQYSVTQLGIPTLRPDAAVAATPTDPVPAGIQQSSAPLEGVAPRMGEGEASAAGHNQNEGALVSEGQNIQVRAEAPVYDEMVGDQLNLNSYAAIAVSGLVSEAFELLAESDIPVTPVSVARLADVLAGIVLRAQYRVTSVASFQRGAQTRLRGLLRSYVEHRPLPFHETASAWETYTRTAEQFLVLMLTEAMGLHARTPVTNDAHLHFAVDHNPAMATALAPTVQ